MSDKVHHRWPFRDPFGKDVENLARLCFPGDLPRPKYNIARSIERKAAFLSKSRVIPNWSFCGFVCKWQVAYKLPSFPSKAILKWSTIGTKIIVCYLTPRKRNGLYNGNIENYVTDILLFNL